MGSCKQVILENHLVKFCIYTVIGLADLSVEVLISSSDSVTVALYCKM